MPASISDLFSTSAREGITKFTNCRLVRGDQLVNEDLWVSADTGKILESQEAFYTHYVVPDQVIDLGGRIIAPGFIDVQLNGALGFDFSVLHDDMAQYGKEFRRVNRGLIKTGVTSYLPTLTSQRSEVYQTVSLTISSRLRYYEQSTDTPTVGSTISWPFRHRSPC